MTYGYFKPHKRKGFNGLMLYMDGFVHLSYHWKYCHQFLVLISTLTSSFMLGF